MKTYAIYPTKNITIDGKAFTPEDQVGVASVDDISLLSLLGAIQFHHCKAVEIDEAEVLRIDDGDEDEGEDIEAGEGYSEGEPVEVLVTEVTGGREGVELSEEPEGSITLAEVEPEAKPFAGSANPTISLFTADGIDEKIATTLAEQGCTPDSIRGLIAEGFDLTELENIGKSRAAALLAVYGPKTE